MGVLQQKLKVSVNVRLVNKNDRNDKMAHKEGWDSYEFTPDELAYAIHQGFAYSVQVAGGIRNQDNFVASDIASVDIDGSRTIDDALNDPFCQQHLTILYPTKSHTQEKHRFRLIFALPRTITDPLEQKAINRALSLRLAGDPSATDAVRIYYGSDLTEPSVFDRGITTEVLDELIAQGKSAPKSDSSSDGSKNASARSQRLVNKDQLVRMPGGQTVALGAIKTKTSIHCPYHHDESPSAFVSFNSRGSQFLHCAVCKTTWWSDHDSNDYDFDSFDKAIMAFKGDMYANTSRSLLFPDADVLPPKRGVLETKIPHVTVHRESNEYFVLDELHNGITFIKSPKGSGKTSSLPSVLAPLAKRGMTLEVFEENYDDEGPPQSLDTDFSILLIGHRRALIRDLCERLDLRCYLDDKDYNYQENHLRMKQYGVCLDSLWKVGRKEYDLVIIDESEQVLSHFLAETLQNREALFSVFHQLLRTAKHVIVLDADLSWISYKTISKLGNAGHASKQDKLPRKHVHVYYNKPEPEPKEIFVFRSKDHLLADFEQQVSAGRRIFLTSNSKAKVDQISQLLEEKHKGVKYLPITSNNSTTDDIQDFIVNIKTRILDYQVVLTSPSLGTGVDITLEGDDVKIDLVYGFFENLINTHFDIDQQIRRVRHPGEVRVWVSPRRFDFETELDAVRNDIKDDENALLTFSWESNLLELATLVTSAQRASKNRLQQNFIEYKKSLGWTPRIVDINQDLVKEGKESFAFGKRIWTEHYAEQLVNAAPMIQGEYLRIEECLEDAEEISEEQMLSFERATLEGFYRAHIDRDLIKLDKQRRFRACVRNYEVIAQRMTDSRLDGELGSTEEERRRKRQVLPMRREIPWLLNALLSETPLYKDHQFDSSAIYSTGDLAGFVKITKQFKKEILNLLELQVPKDLDEKPVSFLRKILATTGIRQNKVKKKRKNNDVTYFYSLDDDSLQLLNTILKRREQQPDRWAFLHELHHLDGALYKREYHSVIGKGGIQKYDVSFLVPRTKGKSVRLKRTDRIGKRYGFDPYLGRQFDESNQRMEERFSLRKEKQKKK